MSRYWLVVGVLAAAFLLWRTMLRQSASTPGPNQALILVLRLADEATPPTELHERLQEVDRALRAAIEGAGSGEVGEPVAAGVDCIYTCYGEDADRLLDAARAGLREVVLLPGSHAIRRFGPPGSPDERTDLETGTVFRS